MDEAIGDVVESVQRGSGHLFAFCNAHTVNLARSSAQFARALRTITLFNDGVGVDIASRLLHAQPFPANLNGTDFTPALLARLQPGARVYLLGSTAEVAEAAMRSLATRFPQLVFCGLSHGFFDADQGEVVAKTIASAAPDLVLVGMGQPRQELWALTYGRSTGATLLCVGAYLDFAAGRFSRAPNLLRWLRLEWLYRLMLEPRRLWKRYLVGNPSFLLYVLKLRRRGNVDSFL